MPTIALIALTVVATVFVVLVIANLTSGEKKIEHKIERLYASDDPQFLRSMGLLLGPPVVDGNRFEVLVNGDEIFPRCSKASARRRRRSPSRPSSTGRAR